MIGSSCPDALSRMTRRPGLSGENIFTLPNVHASMRVELDGLLAQEIDLPRHTSADVRIVHCITACLWIDVSCIQQQGHDPEGPSRHGPQMSSPPHPAEPCEHLADLPTGRASRECPSCHAAVKSHRGVGPDWKPRPVVEVGESRMKRGLARLGRGLSPRSQRCAL